LSVVAKFFSGLEGSDVGHWKLLATIAATLEYGTDEVFVLPREAAEQNGYLLALFSRESAFHWPMKMTWLIKTGDLAQACTFSG
jgi:hypothetical protein